MSHESNHFGHINSVLAGKLAMFHKINGAAMSDELGYIRVVNIKGEEDFRPTKDETLIMMDRSNKVLGNRHFMRGHSRLERERVIEAHREDLEADFAVDGPKRQALWKIAMDIVQNGTRVAAGCH